MGASCLGGEHWVPPWFWGRGRVGTLAGVRLWLGQRSGESHLAFILVSIPQRMLRGQSPLRCSMEERSPGSDAFGETQLLSAFDCKLQKSALLISAQK